MAQYNDLIADIAVGSYGNGNGTITGWSQAWNPTSSARAYAVASDAAAPSGKSLKVTMTTAVRTLLRNDSITSDASRNNIKMLALVRSNTTISGTFTIFGGVAAFGGGASSTETALVTAAARSGSTTFRAQVNQYSGGTSTQLSNIAATTAVPLWYSLSAAYDGTNVDWSLTLYAENDLDGTPISTVSGVDSPVNNANNWAGIFSFGVGNTDILYLSVGTGGDNAPRPSSSNPVSFNGTIPNQTFTNGDAVNVNLASYFSGDFTPFTFANTGGSTSATGLTISSSGFLTGTATTGSATAVVVTATDTESNTASSNSFSITVNPAGVTTTLVTEFDGANVSQSLSSITDATTSTPTINVFGRPVAMQTTGGTEWNHLLFAVDNATGKSINVKLDRASLHETTSAPDANWLPMYSTDMRNWTQVASRTLTGGTTGTIDFTVLGPLPSGLVYISTHPIVQNAYAGVFANELLTSYSSVASPTASANLSGVYNVSPAGTDERGWAIGGNNQYAIKLAWGSSTTDGGPKRKLVLFAGIHAAGEIVSFNAFEAFVRYVLDSSDSQAVALRANWDIYLYFNITPNGVKGGHRRYNFRSTTLDPNRDFVSKTFQETQAVTTAAAADTGGAIDAFMSFHTFAYFYDVFLPVGKDTADQRRFIELAEPIFGKTADPDWVNTITTNDFTWAQTTLGAKIAIDAENGMRSYTAKSYYQAQGVNYAKALHAADADGMFYEAPSASYTLNADGASWSYLGGEASTLLNRVLQADGQSLQYQSAAAELLLNSLLQADGSEWSYAGGAALLTYDTGAATYTLVADGVSLGYSSSNAGLLFNRMLSASGAQYSYSGGIASLTYSGAVSVRINGYTMSYGVVPISAAFAN